MHAWLLCALLASETGKPVVALRVAGTLEGPALAALQAAMVTATQRVLLHRFQVVGGSAPSDSAAVVDVQVRGDRAYVRIQGAGLTPSVVRVPAQQSARAAAAMTWTGPLRDERVADVADAVGTALLHPRRDIPARARTSRVEVSVLEADVDSPDEDLLAVEARTALPMLAACLDRLKVARPARDVEVKVAWDAAGRAVGVHLLDFEDEPAVQQCLTLQGSALSVPANGTGAAVGTLRLHVEPVR